MRLAERVYGFFIGVLDEIIWWTDISPQIHKVFLSPSLGDFRVYLGRVRAVMTYRFARRHVAAYKQHLVGKTFKEPYVGWTKTSLAELPEMDKSSYIKPYSLMDKIIDGTLPERGVMFDESSGSSGKPTSWVRGPRERRMTRRIMQVAFEHFIGPGKHPIILNTFSMGAWATGFNTSMSLIEVGRVKSLGPDITKVVDTLLELGPDFDYIVTGYPPFLRLLTERSEIDWSKYRIAAIYGGEGMSESMREFLLQYFTDVVGSYGASDLEINIAHESRFTIALRKALRNDAKLRELLLVENHGILPMIFQYNPYDYLFETNKKGELLVTICRIYNLSPRVRYNIHDLGHSIDFYKLRKLLKNNGYSELLGEVELDFGLLFHYGRSDLSVDYNGAVVGPEEVRQIIENDEMSPIVKTFRLISYEDDRSRKHLLIALECNESKQLNSTDAAQLLDRIIEQLKTTNLDFKSAISTAQLKPEIRAYTYATGIFDTVHSKLKNDYIWNIDAARAREEGILNDETND